MVPRSLVPASDAFQAFWAERHLATLVTLRGDGRPHVVPVGVTLDLDGGIARVICSAGTQKARNVAERGVAVVSQVDGRRWSTLEGDAVVVRPNALPWPTPKPATPSATDAAGEPAPRRHRDLRAQAPGSL